MSRHLAPPQTWRRREHSAFSLSSNPPSRFAVPPECFAAIGNKIGLTRLRPLTLNYQPSTNRALTPIKLRRTLEAVMSDRFNAASAKGKELVADFRANEKFHFSLVCHCCGLDSTKSISPEYLPDENVICPITKSRCCSVMGKGVTSSSCHIEATCTVSGLQTTGTLDAASKGLSSALECLRLA